MKGKNLLLAGLGGLGLAWLLTRGKAEAAPEQIPPAGYTLMRNRYTGAEGWIQNDLVPVFKYPVGDWDVV